MPKLPVDPLAGKPWARMVAALSRALTRRLRGWLFCGHLKQDGERHKQGKYTKRPVTQVVSKADGTGWFEWPEMPKTQTTLTLPHEGTF